MPTYEQQNLTVAAWTRCYAVVLNNPLDGDKLAVFQEQQVLQADGQPPLMQEAGSCALRFAVDGVIALRDPQTGELTGQTMTHAEFYAVAYSAWRQAAELRDQGVAQAMQLQNLVQA